MYREDNSRGQKDKLERMLLQIHLETSLITDDLCEIAVKRYPAVNGIMIIFTLTPHIGEEGFCDWVSLSVCTCAHPLICKKQSAVKC